MQTINTQFESELKKLIEEEIRRIETNLGTGLAVKDIADYRALVGEINALKKISSSYCDEVTSIINKR